jgi:hypothetical protein
MPLCTRWWQRAHAWEMGHSDPNPRWFFVKYCRSPDGTPEMWLPKISRGGDTGVPHRRNARESPWPLGPVLVRTSSSRSKGLEANLKQQNIVLSPRDTFRVPRTVDCEDERVIICCGLKESAREDSSAATHASHLHCVKYGWLDECHEFVDLVLALPVLE